MENLSLSVFDHGPAALAQLREVLKAFEASEGVTVTLEVIPWENGWQKLIEFALYHHGPDVSEVGSTWVLDLVRMNELRPFEAREIADLEGEAPFFRVVWGGVRGIEKEEDRAWAIPWAADPRVVFYRRDWLQRAGVSETQAFADAEQFEATLQQLQGRVRGQILALPTVRSRRAVHNLASWIWQAGGDFLHPTHNTITFDQPEVLRGFQAYFRLGNYLERQARAYTEQDADQAFWSGKAAVTISGFWILAESRMPAEVRQNLGVTPLLNVPFVGGSHLVIWKSSPKAEMALRLIHFLLNHAAGETLYPLFGLPVRPALWEKAPFCTELYRPFAIAMRLGRSLPAGLLWGLVEKRLVDALAALWEAIADQPAAEMEVIVRHQVENLAYRLRLALEG